MNATAQRLDLRDGYYLSSVEPGDEAALVEHLREKQIHDQTLRIPYPYTRQDAEAWTRSRLELSLTQDKETVFAIRGPDGALIGMIGVGRGEGASEHSGEMGYWLAKPYWNRGIGTQAVAVFSDYALNDLGLIRLEATVFSTNPASARVLDKCGFRREGLLRAKYRRAGRIIDSILYSLVRLPSPAKNEIDRADQA